MSKNLTRKGLAFGALVALGSTLIAGTPASAAGEVVFAPTSGTSYNTFATADFALSASLAPGQVAANITQLKYQIAGGTVGAVEYTVGTAAAAATTATTAATQVVTAASTVGAVNVLNIGLPSATSATATKSVVVTAFIDSDNDSVLDAGEFAQERTVTFKKLSEVSVTVAITAPTVGDTTVKATATIADLNTEQTASGTKVAFTAATSAGVALASAGTAAPGVAVSSGVYSDTVTALAATNVVTARAYFGADALGSAAVSSTVAALTISQPTAAVVKSDNGVVTNNIARTNSAFAVQATIKDTATPAVAKSGVAVSAAVTAYGTLSATRTLSINGTVYNGTVAVPTSFALTSDASGLVTVNLVTVGFAASDAPVVTFSAQNYSAAVTVDLQDAAYTVVSTGVGSALRSIAEGGSTTFNFAVKDQFGVAIGSGARLEAVVGYGTALAGTPAVGNAAVTSYVPVTGGVASVTVTDTTASTLTAIAVTTTLQTQSATTSNWAAASTPIVSAVQTVNVHSAAAAFDTDPTAQSIALSTSATLNTASVNNAGAAVTIAAKGFTFTVGGVDFVDTVTLFSDASGDVASVGVKTNTAGAQTVTWTVGSVSKTAVVTVAAATIGKTLAIVAPTSATPGSTFTVTGTLVDAYGNPVVSSANNGATFSVTYSGPGFVVGGTMPTATSTAGAFSFQVLTGAADAGSGTVTVKYDADGATTTIAEISKTATVLVAAPEVAATIAAATGKINFTIDNAKGELVIIKVANKTVKRFVAYSNAHAFGIKATKGSKAVKVYVAGDLVAAKTVAVK